MFYQIDYTLCKIQNVREIFTISSRRVNTSYCINQFYIFKRIQQLKYIGGSHRVHRYFDINDVLAAINIFWIRSVSLSTVR